MYLEPDSTQTDTLHQMRESITKNRFIGKRAADAIEKITLQRPEYLRNTMGI